MSYDKTRDQRALLYHNKPDAAGIVLILVQHQPVILHAVSTVLIMVPYQPIMGMCTFKYGLIMAPYQPIMALHYQHWLMFWSCTTVLVNISWISVLYQAVMVYFPEWHLINVNDIDQYYGCGLGLSLINERLRGREPQLSGRQMVWIAGGSQRRGGEGLGHTNFAQNRMMA